MAEQQASRQAEQLKAQGNEYFRKGKLGAAIDAYTEAITLCPKVPVYYTNRAVCFRKREEWERVREDCLHAISLDKTSFKAQRLLGLAHLNLKHYPDAIRAFAKALELASATDATGKGLTAPFPTEEVWQELAQAQYQLWLTEAEERKEKQRTLKSEVQRLLKEENARRISDLKQSDTNAARGNGSAAAPMDVDDDDDGHCHRDPDAGARDAAADAGSGAACDGRSTEARGEVEEEEEGRLKAEHEEMLNTLENVFDRAEEPDRPTEPPEHLCCKITMDLLRDPVITPSGITYERAVILDHLARGRNFDPVTRAPLEADQLVPNLAVRDAVQHYLALHGWAYQSFASPTMS